MKGMNLLKLLGTKLGLVVVVALHWILDDLIPIVPDGVVWTITGALFQITGNKGRIDLFKSFWLYEGEEST